MKELWEGVTSWVRSLLEARGPEKKERKNLGREGHLDVGVRPVAWKSLRRKDLESSFEKGIVRSIIGFEKGQSLEFKSKTLILVTFGNRPKFLPQI